MTACQPVRKPPTLPKKIMTNKFKNKTKKKDLRNRQDKDNR